MRETRNGHTITVVARLNNLIPNSAPRFAISTQSQAIRRPLSLRPVAASGPSAALSRSCSIVASAISPLTGVRRIERRKFVRHCLELRQRAVLLGESRYFILERSGQGVYFIVFETEVEL